MTLSQLKIIYSKKDKMHNWQHILKLKRTVAILRKPYKKINQDLLDFITYFHGAKDYLKDNLSDFNKDYVKSLLRHNKKPKLIEEKLVFDANMLTNVGKQGLKKALYVGKTLNRSKEDTYKFIKQNLKKAKFYTKIGKEIGKKEIKILKDLIK